MVQQIVINNKHGGFGISQEAVEWLRENDYEVGEECVLPGEYFEDGSGPRDEFLHHSFGARHIPRDHPGLLAVVGELGEDADGDCAELKVVEVPDGVEWEIEEYDGAEWVAETHRTWG